MSSDSGAPNGKLPFSSYLMDHFHCLPKGRHSDGAHEFQGCSSQKCSRGGVGWGWGGVGHVGVGWGGVGHVGMRWGGSCRGGVGWVGHVGVGWGGSLRGWVGWVM